MKDYLISFVKDSGKRKWDDRENDWVLCWHRSRHTMLIRANSYEEAVRKICLEFDVHDTGHYNNDPVKTGEFFNLTLE